MIFFHNNEYLDVPSWISKEPLVERIEECDGGQSYKVVCKVGEGKTSTAILVKEGAFVSERSLDDSLKGDCAGVKLVLKDTGRPEDTVEVIGIRLKGSVKKDKDALGADRREPTRRGPADPKGRRPP